MFCVVAQTPDHREERSFRDKPEALSYAVDRLRFYEGHANITVESEGGGVVFGNADIHRMIEIIRP